MHCNLRPPDAGPVLIRFNYDAMQSEVVQPILCCITAFLLLIHYFTLWPWPLTFDLDHLQRIACDVIKLCTKFIRNRAIRGRVIAISVFDLMTLNIALRVALGSEIIFTAFDLRQRIRAWIIAFFDADTSCHAVTLTFDLLTFNFYNTLVVMRLNYVQNLSEIE